MTPEQTAMMGVAHVATGAGLGVILTIFLGALALYAWMRGSR